MGQYIKLLFFTVAAFLLVSCGGGGGSDNPSDPQDRPNTSVMAKAPFLGAGMFAVDSPKFDVEQGLDILRSSASPILSYIPGVFGSDKENYPYMMDTLLDEGTEIHVQLYVLCGPCRAPRRDGSLVQFRPDIDIPSLQNAIRWNPEVRSQYLDYVLSVIAPLIDRYPQINFTVVPELEDNQVDDSFAALLDLTMLALGERSNVRYQRNPLNFNGTRTFNGKTIPIEMHTAFVGNLALLIPGDTISLDGSSFTFRGEQVGCNVDANFEQIKELIRQSIDKGVSFHVWRHEWQGLNICGGSAPHPRDRDYRFTHIDQIKELLALR